MRGQAPDIDREQRNDHEWHAGLADDPEWRHPRYECDCGEVFVSQRMRKRHQERDCTTHTDTTTAEELAEELPHIEALL